MAKFTVDFKALFRPFSYQSIHACRLIMIPVHLLL